MQLIHLVLGVKALTAVALAIPTAPELRARDVSGQPSYCGEPDSCYENGCEGVFDWPGANLGTCTAEYKDCNCQRCSRSYTGACKDPECRGDGDMRQRNGMGLCLGGKYLGCQCGGNGPMHVEDEKVLRMSPADLKKLKDEWKAEDKKKKDEAKRIEELSKTDMRPIGDLVMKEMNRRREVEKEWPQFVSEWRRRKYGDYVDKGIDDVKLITRDIEGEVEEQKKKEQEEELEKAKKLLLGPSIMPVVDVNKKRYDTKDLPDYPKGEKEHHYGTEDLPDYPKTKLREEEESALRHPHRFDRPAFYEDRPLRG